MVAPRNRMTTEEAARYLGLHEQTLKRWRQQGVGPEWTRLGQRKVVYDIEKIDAWMEAQAKA